MPSWSIKDLFMIALNIVAGFSLGLVVLVMAWAAQAIKRAFTIAADG